MICITLWGSFSPTYEKRFYMKDKNTQSGVIMIEAALVFPVVIITVVAIMVLGMMKFQESLVQFGSQKIASAAAREAVYQNYKEYIGGSDGMNINLDEFPSSENVTKYYGENDLYKIFGSSKRYSELAGTYKEDLETFVQNYSFLTGMDVAADVKIKGVMSPVVSVNVEYRIKLPGFLGYIGLPDSWKMKTGAYAFAGNPTEFVRNVDIAVDLLDYLLEKLGLDERVDVFLEKLQSIMNKLGG